jgi:hypothetical protein
LHCTRADIAAVAVNDCSDSFVDAWTRNHTRLLFASLAICTAFQVAHAAAAAAVGNTAPASVARHFAFGDARYFGSTAGIALRQPVVGISVTPRGNGYGLATRDGGVFNFGAARFHGAAPGAVPVVAIASSATGDGYWAFPTTGWVGVFGDAIAYPGVPSGTIGVVSAAAT